MAGEPTAAAGTLGPVAAAQRARVLAPQLRALGDETRLTLVILLAARPHTVRELTEATGLGQTLVSHHLAALRDQALVTSTARGRSNVYTLCCDALAAPVQLLADLAVTDPSTQVRPEAVAAGEGGVTRARRS